VKQPTIPELIRGIAERVLAERDSGRQVDPTRVRWAEAVMRGEQPLPDAAKETA
jgi:hypothetical protein